MAGQVLSDSGSDGPAVASGWPGGQKVECMDMSLSQNKPSHGEGQSLGVQWLPRSRVVGQAHQVCLTPYLVSVPLFPGVPLPPSEALSSGLGPGVRRAGFLPEEHTCPAHRAHRWAWCWESSR